ncbi:MAG: type I-U CRISPR-associated helicase/endonuclease Cas3, partial [Planctomycetes bacterium]|nr:type I-U CRISPR-associated helicase/endonuclease Cas3 [Planctomycetota bacterium]
MADTKAFDGQFTALTGAPSPFPWQRRLWDHLRQADFDACSPCSLPTGMGKTSIIPIWLIALAGNPDGVPRRLVYVVNRRTVVDQATEEVKRIRERLVSGAVPDLCNALREMCAIPTAEPLAISTLRGQFADNAEWRIDPARPAVIIGTVDMVGSRLLFSGYGTGFRSRSVHAGLLGQDALLIHDEAHLEPAFQSLLNAIVKEQRNAGEARPLRVIELTATSRSAASTGFRLDSNDLKDKTVAKRMKSRKRLRLHACDAEGAVCEAMLQKALDRGDSAAAVLVFTRRVEDAERIAAGLRKKGRPVALLTGTMRGFERDRLASADPVFARFLPPSSRPSGVVPAEGAVYLVCTSAGEVGINISSDHLVCDLTPFDSMAQRFGRVNRFGEGDACVDVFHPKEFDAKDPLASCRHATLELLRALSTDGKSHDASPSALAAIPEDSRVAAFTPPPEILPATDVLFDAWSLTTIRHELPGRPPVADWLHGVAEWQPPDTSVAWRDEVSIVGDRISGDEAEELIADYPLKSHELLRDRQHRVFAHLERIAARVPDEIAWVISPSGTVSIYALASLVQKNNSKAPLVNLTDCVVLLSPRSGGLSETGTLDGDSLIANDIADAWLDEAGLQKRVRLWDSALLPAPSGWRLVRVIDTASEDDGTDPDSDSRRFWKWFTLPRSADDDGSFTSAAPQRLDDHLKRAENVARRLAAA